MQQTVAREPGEMSWARAIVLATGFFFLSAIYLGQIPGFFQLASTQATLGLFSQVLLTLGLLALGLGLIGITAVFLYDPKPLTRLFVPLFALLGLVLLVAGAGLMIFTFVTGHHYLPDQTVIQGKPPQIINWPNPNQTYLFNPIWFQPQSIDIGAVGFVLLFTGGGIFGFAALQPLHMSGRLTGALRSGIMQFCIGIAAAILLAYMTMYTFSPDITTKTYADGLVYNIILGAALALVLFATQVWLLPVMTEKRNRERFLPSLYLHSVMLIGNVAAPLLAVFLVLYPVATWMWNVNLGNAYFVQCSSKTQIPASCTFTSYVGYIIAAVVAGMFFTFMLIAGYLWTKKTAFVRLGSLFGYIFAALAVVATHTGNSASTVWPRSIPMALMLAIGVAILGFVWMVSTQREFVPAQYMNASLGCVGQWLVMGTTLFIYIAAFAFFSYPNFTETEGNLVIVQGANSIHDAYWVLLIAGGLAALQFAFLIWRRPLGQVRKATLWLVLIGATLMIGSSIHFNLGDSTNMANPAFWGGLVVEVLGILASVWGALGSRAQRGMTWLILMAFSILVGGGGIIVIFASGSTMYQLVVAFAILMAFGSLVYVIFGSDPPERLQLDTALTMPTTSVPEE